jgi:hypothetical protein
MLPRVSVCRCVAGSLGFAKSLGKTQVGEGKGNAARAVRQAMEGGEEAIDFEEFVAGVRA